MPTTLSSEMYDNGLTIVYITGDLDTNGTREIEDDFNDALAQRDGYAIIDMNGVSFMSSAALAMFVVQAQAMQRSGGQIYLAGVTAAVHDLFVQAGFDDVFVMYGSLDEAMSDLGMA
ncbi:MAG: STAS domain-containing protein [Chloroflexi bacterium]|nr:STAS domain-containing protein [Chloroflexota bacterium]